MSSNFKNIYIYIYIYIDGFLTQWSFHRVKEHLNRSSDEGVMNFRSLRSYTVKS